MAATEEPGKALDSAPKPHTPGFRAEQPGTNKKKKTQHVEKEEKKVNKGNSGDGTHGSKMAKRGDKWESPG